VLYIWVSPCKGATDKIFKGLQGYGSDKTQDYGRLSKEQASHSHDMAHQNKSKQIIDWDLKGIVYPQIKICHRLLTLTLFKTHMMNFVFFKHKKHTLYNKSE